MLTRQAALGAAGRRLGQVDSLGVAEDPGRRREIAKEGRLYLLALVCATGGALTVYLTNRLATGIFVFLLCVLVLGSLLYRYEKRHRGE